MIYWNRHSIHESQFSCELNFSTGVLYTSQHVKTLLKHIMFELFSFILFMGIQILANIPLIHVLAHSSEDFPRAPQNCKTHELVPNFINISEVQTNNMRQIILNETNQANRVIIANKSTIATISNWQKWMACSKKPFQVQSMVPHHFNVFITISRYTFTCRGMPGMLLASVECVSQRSIEVMPATSQPSFSS